MTIYLGCIADDFTGATDLGSFLVTQGFRTIQLNGVPKQEPDLSEIEAVVIALKTRTIAPKVAVKQSLAALEKLKSWDCQQYYFKYCSTFDSTDSGNIGPVIDALLDLLGEVFTIACPALPVNGRTVYQGHLFVNGVLLSESGMQDHPLTPMTDPNLVRVLGRQVRSGVGLVPLETVEAGVHAIRNAFQVMVITGVRYAIVDALTDRHLKDIGTAVKTLKLITGGSGLSINLRNNFDIPDAHKKSADHLPKLPGNVAMLSGSCSTMTREQVARAKDKYPSFYLDPSHLIENPQFIDKAIQWALEKVTQDSVLIYSTSAPEKVKTIQDQLGLEKAGELVESSLKKIAKALAAAGVRKFVIAGGETSGSIVKALNVTVMRIGPEIAPGVPWTVSQGQEPLALALKSGNFGSPDFFEQALELIK
ncbi:MAG: four-carbon acid sugar kinase family protein [Anaerolineae bacterium]|nr:four-carbon acid sugar kinase family protein [Anaerolineae bacterium]